MPYWPNRDVIDCPACQQLSLDFSHHAMATFAESESNRPVRGRLLGPGWAIIGHKVFPVTGTPEQSHLWGHFDCAGPAPRWLGSLGLDFHLNQLKWLQIDLDRQPIFRVPWDSVVNGLLSQYRLSESAAWQVWMRWFEPLLRIRYNHELQQLSNSDGLRWSLSGRALAHDFIQEWLWECQSQECLLGVEVWDSLSEAWRSRREFQFEVENISGRFVLPGAPETPAFKMECRGPAGLILSVDCPLDEVQMSALVAGFPLDGDPETLFEWTSRLAVEWEDHYAYAAVVRDGFLNAAQRGSLDAIRHLVWKAVSEARSKMAKILGSGDTTTLRELFEAKGRQLEHLLAAVPQSLQEDPCSEPSLAVGSEVVCVRTSPATVWVGGDVFELVEASPKGHLGYCLARLTCWGPPTAQWLEDCGVDLSGVVLLELHLEGKPWCRLDWERCFQKGCGVQLLDALKDCRNRLRASKDAIIMEVDGISLGRVLQLWRNSLGERACLRDFWSGSQWTPWSQLELEYRGTLGQYTLQGDWRPPKASKRPEFPLTVTLREVGGQSFGIWKASHSASDLQKILEGVDSKFDPEVLMNLVEQFERGQVVREGGTVEKACQAAAQRGNLRARIWLCHRVWRAACAVYQQWAQPALG